jgi:general secretion pathway protein L
VISYLLIDAIQVQRHISRLDQQIMETFKTTFPEVRTVIDPYMQMQVKLKEVKKQTLISSDPWENVRAIDMLNQISTNIPEDVDVNFTRLVIGDGTIQITGDTDTFEVVEGINNRIEQSELFKKVVTASANKEASENRVRFKLKVEL